MNPINYNGLGNVPHNMTHHGHNNYLNHNQKTLKRPNQ
jgi:hypothetical protein